MEIQRQTPARNEFGEITPGEWNTVAIRWGSVEGVTGREFFAAERVQADVTHRVRLRYCAGFDTRDRLKHGSKVFTIESVRDPDGRRVELEVMAKESV